MSQEAFIQSAAPQPQPQSQPIIASSALSASSASPGRSGWYVVLSALAAMGAAACTDPEAGAGAGKSYVLVHGAWMGGAGWEPVAVRLRAEDAEVHVLDLPAHGADPGAAAAATLDGYVERVSEALDSARRPVILVGHSMAGVVISQVAERRPADIASLVYVAAYAPASGQSLFDLAMSDAGSQIGPALVFGNDHTIGIKADAFADLFCADCDADARTALAGAYRPEPDAPLATPVTLTAGGFGTVRRSYLRTARDRVVSPSLQAAMIAATPMDREVTLDTSHVPLLAAPDQVAAALLEE
jgi:pimeloyl-ACP methyl ester carboxylesterase